MRSDNKIDMLSQLVRICKVLNEHSPIYSEDFYRQIEMDTEYDSTLYVMIQNVFDKFKQSDKREDFVRHLEEILINFRAIERRILLLKIAERSYKDPLYRGFCEYEQLKIFIDMNLDYITEFFQRPFSRYQKFLAELQEKMQADDDDDDNAGLILENVQQMIGNQKLSSSKQQVYKNANTHFKTETAFSHVKQHQLVEASCERGRLALGSSNIELDLRVRLMKTACNQLRLNRFFLMAIELKEKEKNLLMQSFAYGDDQNREE